jgi:hypothetical protein
MAVNRVDAVRAMMDGCSCDAVDISDEGRESFCLIKAEVIIAQRQSSNKVIVAPRIH